ncbi:unnamed protein product, partial [Closterium sp. NIES-54]
MCGYGPCSPLAYLTARSPPLPPACGPRDALAARSPPACSPRAAPAAFSQPACSPRATLRPARRPCSPLTTLSARSPPLQPTNRSLAAYAPPLQPARRGYGLLAALPARSPPACGPLAALLQPARRPLQPARRPLLPARRTLQPARSPRAAHSPPGYCLPLQPPLLCMLVVRHPGLPTMASLNVLTFNHEGLRDHFLALDPIDLTVDLLEQHLLAAETSVVAVGAPRGTPRTPFFEGCSPSPLPPSYAFAAAVDILGAEDVWEASSISGKRRSSKGKGGKSGGGGSRGGSGGGSGGGGGSGCGGSDGSGGGSGGSGGDGGGSGEGVAVVAAVGVVAVGLKLFRGEVLVVARGSSSSVGARTLLPCSF